ncbi:MAG: acyl-CoA/acyl-ACP dehydrogenase [Acidimicrobiia bacterium]|nr:acyl-CoA/acyl-ACP dehydrogenase [Acidimicrobiia bacterium]MDH4306469.1 acyl-CoA/acyl-ACP dehydrogenase [Acidimicrobiia bacterium]MDH5292947.1 acyl-CoA/acyl-ACP dehydrogenase [Acidimicrobiia bacterium]MDH5520516.1 acyl-CoA/acyl-ACP dehydrogenase [Acidimicrobiia bacterium]
MNFSFSPEQEELRRYAAQWLADKSASASVRELMETEEGFDRALWREAAEMGWQAMAIPEGYGGAGFGFLELVVLLEEQGAALFPSPFFSTVVLAATALLEAGSEEQKTTWLPRIASGEVVATLAVTEPSGDWTESGIQAIARRTGDGWVLNGEKSFVLDGHTADVIVVAALVEGEVSLFLVEGDAVGVTRTVLETMDQTRKLASVRLDEVVVDGDARLTGSDWGTVERVHRTAAVALAAEQVGGARRCLDMAVAYAKDRHQFGRPIGSFQAIKHMCADMLVQVESARSAAYYAGWAVSEGSAEVPELAALAKSYCSEAFYRCAADNIQIHGGIGFTWEHDAHLYFKRAKSSELLFGSPAHHRRLLADLIGI